MHKYIAGYLLGLIILMGAFMMPTTVHAFGCHATPYKAADYFSDADMLSIAEDISCKRTPSIEKITAARLKLNEQAKDNMTLLWWTFLAKDVDSFKALVEAGADPTIPLKRAKSSKQLTLINIIFMASEDDERYLEMFKIWLETGGNPNFYAHPWKIAQNRDAFIHGTKTGYQSLLDSAGTYGYVKAAKLLLANGADPNFRAPFAGLYPLQSSIGSFEVFKLIYDAGGEWDRIIKQSRIDQESQLPIDYDNLCGGVYERSPQEDRQSYYQVVKFLQQNGHELPQKCLNILSAGKP